MLEMLIQGLTVYLALSIMATGFGFLIGGGNGGARVASWALWRIPMEAAWLTLRGLYAVGALFLGLLRR